MPTLPSYCRPAFREVDGYFLRFARISGWDAVSFSAIHRETIIATLNLLPQAGTTCQALLPLIYHNIRKADLFAHASQWGARKVLFYLLENLRVVMETPIAPSLSTELAPFRLANRINQKILQSRVLTACPDTLFRYRLLQLVSQITFPDHPLNGIRFQIDYARTRLADLVASR